MKWGQLEGGVNFLFLEVDLTPGMKCLDFGELKEGMNSGSVTHT